VLLGVAGGTTDFGVDGDDCHPGYSKTSSGIRAMREKTGINLLQILM
jgi:hypothetical protein